MCLLAQVNETRRFRNANNMAKQCGVLMAEMSHVGFDKYGLAFLNRNASRC